MSNLVQIVVYGMTVGSVLALVALGYNLVFATSRVVNFAQGSMLVVGGYIAFAFVRAGVPLWGAVPLSALAGAAVGVAIDVVAIRPLREFDPGTSVGWILTTFAAGLILLDVIKLTIGAEPRTIPALADSVFGWRGSTVAGIPIVPADVLIVVSALVLMVVGEYVQRHTMAGRALRAVSQDRAAASLMGINPRLTVTASFAIAGALGALAAVLLAPRLFVKFDNGTLLGIQAFVAAVIGGLGSTRGAVLGGFVLGFVGAILRVVSSSGGQYEPLVIFVVFLLVLVVRPTGLLGLPVVEKA
ncbi:MAG TPA: branched-chain amino acid ABC transporter permease [Acidimicrobiales bacterium]|nr:branched-chain amino acid ABC transporter permease [Acidimicrobiales bacterium]HVV37392.1 branched-chain amino acid ABC transporter permease [Acidimicrobiales bacterium]